MRVNIITAEQKLLEEEAREVILPGADGELSVLDFHQPFLYYLRSGQIKVVLRRPASREEEKRIPIKKGIASFESNTLRLMVEVP